MLEITHHIVLVSKAPNPLNDVYLCPFDVVGPGAASQSWVPDGETVAGPVLRRQFTMYHFPDELFPKLIGTLLGDVSCKPYVVKACGGNRVIVQGKEAPLGASCHTLLETVVIWRGPADVPAMQAAVLDPKLGVIRYIGKPAVDVVAAGLPIPSFEDRLRANIRSLKSGCLNVLAYHTMVPKAACGHASTVSHGLCTGRGEAGASPPWSTLTAVLQHVRACFSDYQLLLEEHVGFVPAGTEVAFVSVESVSRHVATRGWFARYVVPRSECKVMPLHLLPPNGGDFVAKMR